MGEETTTTGAATQQSEGGASTKAAEAPKLSDADIALLERAKKFPGLFSEFEANNVEDEESLAEYIQRTQQEHQRAQLPHQFDAELGQITKDRKQAEDEAGQVYHRAIDGGADAAEARSKFMADMEKIDRQFTKRENDVLRRAKDALATTAQSAGNNLRGDIKGLSKTFPDIDPVAMENFAKANPKGDLRAEAERQQKRHDAGISKYAGKKKDQQEQSKVDGTRGADNGAGGGQKVGPGMPAGKITLESLTRQMVRDADATIADWQAQQRKSA